MQGSDRNLERNKAELLSRGTRSAVLGKVNFIPMVGHQNGTGFQNLGDVLSIAF